MERLHTIIRLPNEMLAGVGSPLSSLGAGTSSSEHTQLFEAALSLVQALIKQPSSAGGAHGTPSAEPSEPGLGNGAPGGNAPFGAPSGIVPPSAATFPATVSSGADTGPSGTSPGAPMTSAGAGPNSTTITNTSNHEEKIGQFSNGGSTTTPTAEIDLKPGRSGTLKYQNGRGGFDEEADSSGKYQPGASRLEFYADQNGKNNDDVSYIDDRNASISVSDGQGHTAGDTQSIAANAPAGTVTRDAAGNPTIQGWYDGSTGAMQSGGAYMQSKLGTGDSYIHPTDDRNKTPGANPMTMAGDTSQHYTATFGNA